MALTHAGQQFLPYAQACIAAFDEAIAAVQATTPSRSRRIRVGYPLDTSRKVMGLLTAELQAMRGEGKIVEAATSDQHRMVLSANSTSASCAIPTAARACGRPPPCARRWGW